MQIIPRENHWEGLGTGLGQLAAMKIANLVKSKQQKQERSQFAETWAPYLGRDTANFLSNLSPEERKSALQNIGSLAQLNQQPSSAQQASQLGGLESPQQLQQFSQQQMPGESQQENATEQLNPDRANLIQDIFTSPHEKREREKLSLKKQEVESKFNKEVREFSRPYVEKASKAKANIRDYEELIKTAKSGNLRSGNTYQLLSKLGLQDFGRNTDTEKAGKLIARLAQNIAGVFGTNARITNFLEQTFQRSLPSLINTPEGIQAISIINMAADKAELIKNDIRKELIKKNGGRLTAEIEDEIAEKADPIIRQIEAQAFRDAENVTRSKTKSSRQFNELPPASQYNGQKIRDRDTGKVLVSNGQQWIPLE